MFVMERGQISMGTLSPVSFWCLIFFVQSTIPQLTAIRQLTYVAQQYCNVTVSVYDVITPPRGSVACAIACSGRSACRAYVYHNMSGCHLYLADLENERVCSESEEDSLRAFVQINPCQHDGWLRSDGSCRCVNSYVGTFCERLMEDCTEGEDLGDYTEDKKYWIHPRLAPHPFQVPCQMSSGKGITQIQMRVSAGLSFNRTWLEYKEGFELTPKNFWTGNDKLHWITVSHPHHLIVQLQETTTVFYQRYFNNFVMTNETSDYAVTHTGSWSPADKLMEDCWPGTSLKFSTFDRDNDDNEDNCAAIYGAGFWFQSENCTVCNPNGDVYPSLTSRLGIESENFWTPTLGDWNPRAVGIFLVRQ